MWPYLDKEICNTVKKIAKPIIDEQIPKYKIESVEFEALTFGCLTPTFQGMKVCNIEDNELIMELLLKCVGNHTIIVVVKAFSLRATIQVLNLQVFACPYITLKPLVPSFPCFYSILVSLIDMPHVNFGLKLLGADAMSIPGLYRFVQELIKDQVADMYLWPKTLQLAREEPKALTLDLLKNLNANDAQNKNSQVQIVLEAIYKPLGENEMPNNIKVSNEVEEFQYTVEEPPMNDRIHVEVVRVLEDGSIPLKETLGYVDIYLSDVTSQSPLDLKLASITRAQRKKLKLQGDDDMIAFMEDALKSKVREFEDQGKHPKLFTMCSIVKK
ncbi:hypothetical protein M9H77_23383 [Catharanthus roseus]|uniref:Uncharacterized protein n=1 Tax=Catharanthus roseus TaxID=4058 RepID=A0ACC0AT68_CATRO|nr:hypothetical protein M9H77_23383 [Catharanthus roseus]